MRTIKEQTGWEMEMSHYSVPLGCSAGSCEGSWTVLHSGGGLGKCACFCAEGIGSPSPANEGGSSCGGARNKKPHVKQL
eukprot:scaffold20483_cov101-Isochrysis_galbana.AAC.4